MIQHEKKSTKNNSVTNAAAAVAAISAVASSHDITSKSSLAVISAAVEIEKILRRTSIDRNGIGGTFTTGLYRLFLNLFGSR